MSNKARPFSTEGGRKWLTLCYLQALGMCVAGAIVVQAIFLPDLQTDQLIQVFGLMATIAATFIGVQGAIDFRTAGSSPSKGDSSADSDGYVPDIPED